MSLDTLDSYNPWSHLAISFHLSQSTFVPLRHSKGPPLNSILVRCRSPDPSAPGNRDQKHWSPGKPLSLLLCSVPLSVSPTPRLFGPTIRTAVRERV